MAYVVFKTPGAGSWVVPTDFNPSLTNKIHLIGAGGGGACYAGGGGGEYRQIYNIHLSPGKLVNFKVGAGGQSQNNCCRTWTYNSVCTQNRVATTFGSSTPFGANLTYAVNCAVTAQGGYNGFRAFGQNNGVGGDSVAYAGYYGGLTPNIGTWLNFIRDEKSTLAISSAGGRGPIYSYSGGGAGGPRGPGSGTIAGGGYGGTGVFLYNNRYYGGQGNDIGYGYGSGAGGTLTAYGGLYGGGAGEIGYNYFNGIQYWSGGQGGCGLILIEYNLGLISTRLTEDGTLYINGTFNETATSVISLVKPLPGQTSAKYYANEFDDVSLSRPNGSILFNGNQYIQVSSSTSVSNPLDLSTGSPWWTIEFWFKTSTTSPSAQIIIDKDGTAGVAQPSYTVKLVGSVLQWSVGLGNGGSGAVGNLSGISTNNWYHFALTRYKNTLTSYLQGIVRDTVNMTFVMSGLQTKDLMIGAGISADGVTLNSLFEGNITDLRITKGSGSAYGASTSVPFTPNVKLANIPGTSILLSAENSLTYYKDLSPYNFQLTSTSPPSFSSDYPSGYPYNVKKRETSTATLMAIEFDEVRILSPDSGTLTNNFT